MSTKAKFVALLTITVMLMSFLIKSHSFSALHKKNPQPVDMFTTLVIVGVFAGLIMIVVLALYFRDIPGSKKHFECDDGFTLGHFIVSFLFGLIFSILFFRFFFTNTNVAKKATNGTVNCTSVNGLALNCTVPSVGPLSTSGNNSGLEYSSSPVATHLWIVFLFSCSLCPYLPRLPLLPPRAGGTQEEKENREGNRIRQETGRTRS